MLKRFLSSILLLICSATYASQTVDLSSYDFTDKKVVFAFFEDSRLVRELESFGTPEQKKQFQKTISTIQSRIANNTINQFSKSKNAEKYKGKNIVADEFRTPGQGNNVKINTDWDVRLGFYEFPGDKNSRFIEIPTKYTEQLFYKELAKQTGSPEADDINKLKAYAEKLRVVLTDQHHIEAPRDFSDQNRSGKVNFKDVVAGKAILTDPTGFSEVFFEKPDEQFRQAREISNQLKNNKISTQERSRLKDKKNMHESEGFVQLKKAIKNLQDVRDSYKKQGIEVGELPNNLQKIINLDSLKQFKGRTSDDLSSLKKDLTKHGSNFDKLNRHINVQIESLKWAPSLSSKSNQAQGSITKKIIQKPTTKTVSARGIGIVGIAGDVMSIEQRLNQAKQGNNWLVNFDEGDSDLEQWAKTGFIASLELLPVPITDYADRGFDVDEKIKKSIELSIARGEEFTPAEIGMLMVGGSLIETAKMMIIDPATQIFEGVTEGSKTLSDIWTNQTEDVLRAQSVKLQAEKLKSIEARQAEVALSDIKTTRTTNNGSPISSYPPKQLVISPNDDAMLSFSVDGIDELQRKYKTKWELFDPYNKIVDINFRKTLPRPMLGLEFIKRLKPGQHRVVFRVYDKDGKQMDSKETAFTVKGFFGMSSIICVNKSKNYDPSCNNNKIGDKLDFSVGSEGNWTKDYKIEWLVNGERHKYEDASNPSSNTFTLKLTEDGVSNYRGTPLPELTVSVRALPVGSESEITAHQKITIKVEQYDPNCPKKILEKHQNGNKSLEGCKNKEGKRIGYWKWWNESGDMTVLSEYKNGKQHGTTIFYKANGKEIYQLWDDGNRMLHGTKLNGELNGKMLIWYKSGVLKSESMYKNGKKHGKGITRHENNQKKVETNFKHGKRHGKYYQWTISGSPKMFDGYPYMCFDNDKKVSCESDSVEVEITPKVKPVVVPPAYQKNEPTRDSSSSCAPGQEYDSMLGRCDYVDGFDKSNKRY